jgi:hypothetical protein
MSFFSAGRSSGESAENNQVNHPQEKIFCQEETVFLVFLQEETLSLPVFDRMDGMNSSC